MKGENFDPLWVPVLSHYDGTGAGTLDRDRTGRHLASLAPAVRQYLIAGTTGDGWRMSAATLEQWLDLTTDERIMPHGSRFLVGAFGSDAAAVIRRAERIEAHVANRSFAAEFVGLTLCPPVRPGISQAGILRHFRDILSAASAPVAIYQLPQITGCEIAPESFAELAASEPRIILFKDTSGADRVAEAATETGSVRLLRGAEGDYARHLKPRGRYDGWLLSTANGFAPELRAIADAATQGDAGQAEARSAVLTRRVEALFAAAAPLGGNAFADANRGVDHLRAHGGRWRDFPAHRADGSALPVSFLEQVERLLVEEAPLGPGYLESASSDPS